MRGRVLVTGGAGYIGAHACKALARAGFVPVTFDNLSTGHSGAVKYGPLVKGDLNDQSSLQAAFADHRPIAIMHFAALSVVGEAMVRPGQYWRQNVLGALNLFEAADAAGCRVIVFSSTCATYGDQDGVLLDEWTVQRPINAYGSSKRAIEDMLKDFGATHGFRSMIFRYFNVAGADPAGEIGEAHHPETHLVPLVLQAIQGQRTALTIHGTDYPTPDGTCIRDYVHVSDLVDAHVLGLEWLLAGRESRVFCLGSGTGFSVRQVIAAAEAIVGRPVPVTDGPRRAGDAVSLVSRATLAQTDLGWKPSRSGIQQMIADAWRWHQSPAY